MRRHMKHILVAVWKGCHRVGDVKRIKSMHPAVWVADGRATSLMDRASKAVGILAMLGPGAMVVAEVVDKVEVEALGIREAAKLGVVVVAAVLVLTALFSKALDIKMLTVVSAEPLTKLGPWFGVLTRMVPVEWLA
jgi:hypothetical protein